MLLLCLPAFGVGCGSHTGESGAGSPGAATTGTAATLTTVVTDTTQQPPGGTPPAELQGTWLTDSGGGPLRLYIRGDRYTLASVASAQGDVVVDGSVVAFFNQSGASCPPDPQDDVGRYKWNISDGKLRLKLLGKDPCSPRVSDLTNAPFERVG